MERIAIKLGPINIYWYAIFVFTGMLVASVLAYKEAKKQGYNKDFFTNLIFYILLYGILGARLYYVVFNFNYYLNNPLEIFQIWNGGLAIHGGILAGILTIYFYCKKYNVEFIRTLDVFSASLIIAQAIGRWGNFFNQECYGQAISKSKLLAYKIPEFIVNNMYINGEYHHPTFLYESIWNVIGFIILIIIRRKKYTKVGTLAGFYLCWYSFGRFFTEGLRYAYKDSLMIFGLKQAQVLSVILFIAGIIIIIIKHKGSRFDNLYNDGVKNEIRF